MTPKQKAESLVNGFKPNMYCYIGSGMLSDDYSESAALKNAKECAQTVCNEVIEEVTSGPWLKSQVEYWKAVKAEINDL